MILKRCAVALCLVFAAGTAAAADPLLHRLTPEVPVSEAIFGPSAGSQFAPEIATDGNNFLVAWLDTRSGAASIRATRIDAAGNVLDPYSLLLGSTGAFGYQRPRMAWVGRHYLVVWTTSDGQHVGVRVTADGVVLDRPPKPLLLPTGVEATAFASDGFRTLLAWTDESPRGRIIGADFEVLVPDFELAATGYRVLAAAAGDDFLVALIQNECASGCPRIVVQRISKDGRKLGEFSLPFAVDWQDAADFASDGAGNYLLVVANFRDRSLLAHRLSPSGPAGPPNRIPDARAIHPSFMTESPSVAWTGQAFVLVWSEEVNQTFRQVRTATIGADGSVIELPRPVSESGHPYDGSAAVATRGNDALVVWVERAGSSHYDFALRGRFIAGDGRSGEFPITSSAVPQHGPAVASTGSVHLVLWTDSGSPRHVLRAARVTAGGSLDGPGIEVASRESNSQVRYPIPAAVASDGASFLIVWVQNEGVFTRRLGVDGKWLDTSARHSGLTACDFGEPRLVWNGATYFLVRATCSGLYPPFNQQLLGVFLDRDGDRVGTDHQIATPSYEIIWSVDAVFNGREYMVLWNGVGICQLCACPPPQATIRVTRVRANGSVPDARGTLLTGFATPDRPSMDWGAGVFLASWSGYDGIHATRLSEEGTMLDGKSGGILLHGLPNPTPTETVWTGSQFVLIWRERGPDGAIKGATLRPDVLLARQQLDPVTIAEDPTGAFSLYYETADAVNTPEGLVIAYTRTGGDEVGGVQRVFTRMALAPTNRSRATRR